MLGCPDLGSRLNGLPQPLVYGKYLLCIIHGEDIVWVWIIILSKHRLIYFLMLSIRSGYLSGENYFSHHYVTELLELVFSVKVSGAGQVRRLSQYKYNEIIS